MEKLKNNKLYTAEEVIDIIKKGWGSEKELIELQEFIDDIEMESDELRELQYSGYLEIVFG